MSNIGNDRECLNSHSFTVTLSVRDGVTGLSGDGVTSLLRHLMALLPGHIATHLLGHWSALLAGHLPRHLLAVLLGNIVTLLLGGWDTLLHLSDFTTFWVFVLTWWGTLVQAGCPAGLQIWRGTFLQPCPKKGS